MNNFFECHHIFFSTFSFFYYRPLFWCLARDREDRLRLIKDQQNLERQRKLDELKAQAFAAQKYREQKEEERKRRIDEMRMRENDKRQQVMTIWKCQFRAF